jgi:hypothetical protein
MKYFKLVSLWLFLIWLSTLFGEYVVSREVNGFLQLLSFVGLLGVLMYVINETIKILTKNKKND